MIFLFKYIKPVVDPFVTAIFWIYYIGGYLVFFWPFHLWAYFFSANRELGFQKVNRRIFQSFFFVMRLLMPGLKLHIPGEVMAIRSSVIVCNHLSFLDPILLVSLYEKQKTIAKSTFFKLPVFGWLLKNSGYLPSDTSGHFFNLMRERIADMPDYLAGGGNLFIFPEGTRSRDGKIGTFNKGAFSIAKKCRAPIAVLHIRNTGSLFSPDKILFNTCVDITLSIELITILKPAYDDDNFSLTGLMESVQRRYKDAR
jgi:1-acyl-sn-glycerol-3-phosphate acyltransferase